VEGIGRIRVGEETLTVPQHGGVLVGPRMLRQVFNDTDSEVLLADRGSAGNRTRTGQPFDKSLYYPSIRRKYRPS